MTLILGELSLRGFALRSPVRDGCAGSVVSGVASATVERHGCGMVGEVRLATGASDA